MINKKLKLIVGTGISLLAIGVLAWKYAPLSQKKTDPYLPKSAEATSTPAAHTASTPSPSPVANQSVIPVSTAAQTSPAGDLTIVSPTQGSTVTSGTRVSGTAKTSQATLYFRLKGGKSGQLASGSIQVTPNTSSAQPYSFELAFMNQVAGGADQGVLEVYTLSSNGSEASVANVTVNIQG